MKLIEILKPNKLALYTAIILSSSFFVVACDNAKTPNVAEKPAEMSQQQLSDFIKSSINNFISKYNASQSLATVSLDSFTPSADNQQITMVLSTALPNLDENDEQPIVINSTYLITQEQSLQNNAYTVAKFTSQNTTLANSSAAIDKDSFIAFTKQFVEDSGITQHGYIMASGDITSELNSSNAFDYASSSEDLKLNVLPFSYHYQTKDKMSSVDVNYELPSVSILFDNANLLAKNINAKLTDHSFDDKFSYTGKGLYTIDSIAVNYDSKDILFKDITIESNSNIDDNGLVNQYASTSFSGNFPDINGKKINFSVDGNVKVEHLNLVAAQKWSEYASSPAFTYGTSDEEKLKLFSELFKDGFSFAITDTNIALDDAKGKLNFTFDVVPMDISATDNTSALFVQILNSVTVGVDSVIPVEWFNIIGIGLSQDNLDKMIKQAIQQVNAMGYDGAVTYDGKKVTTHFDIKKGNVFVNGELKGSLLNTFAAFM